jgi:predicted nucleic acid-binding protein
MLLLDSEALSAVANGPPERRDRVRALVGEMRKRELSVSTVSVILAEVVRGRAADAAVFGALRRERVLVHAVDTRTAVRTGRLLGRAARGSEHAIDAFLVAVADLAGGAVIATVDVDDLELFAQHAKNVKVVSIQPGRDER